jgi:hypothetical protein
MTMMMMMIFITATTIIATSSHICMPLSTLKQQQKVVFEKDTNYNQKNLSTREFYYALFL